MSSSPLWVVLDGWTRYLADHGEAVVGVDILSGMVEIAPRDYRDLVLDSGIVNRFASYRPLSVGYDYSHFVASEPKIACSGNASSFNSRCSYCWQVFWRVPKKAEPLRPPWGANQTQLNQAAARSAETLETVAKLGKPLSWVGNGLEAMNGYNEIVNSTRAGKPAVQAVVDVAPKTVGNIAGGWAGAAIGAEWGASAGLIVGGPAGAVIGAGIGAIAGGVAGSEFGEKAGELLSKGLNALLSWWLGGCCVVVSGRRE